MAQTGEVADQIDDPVAPHEKHIADVAQVREPPHVLNNRVQLVPVHDEQAASIRRFVNGVFLKGHAGIVSVESGKEFIVIADDVNDLRPLPAFAQKFLDDIIMFLRPINTTTQGPYVDEISDEIEGVKLHIPQKCEQGACLASSGSKVNIGYPAGAIARCHTRRNLSP